MFYGINTGWLEVLQYSQQMAADSNKTYINLFIRESKVSFLSTPFILKW